MLKFPAIFLAVAIILLAVPALLSVQSASAQPASPATAEAEPPQIGCGAGEACAPLSLLQQLDRETKSLYDDLQSSVVRVQLPTPRWINDLARQSSPLDKWGHELSPQMKAALEETQEEFAQGKIERLRVNITATTEPSAATNMPPVLGSPFMPYAPPNLTPNVRPNIRPGQTPAGNFDPSADRSSGVAGSSTTKPALVITANPADHTLTIHSGGENSNAVVQLRAGPAARNGVSSPGVQIVVQPADSFAPNNVGLVVDDQGHIVVPLFLEKEAIPQDGVRVMIGDGPVKRARFVGSDRLTNLTVLKLDEPAGKPIKLGPRRLRDGSLFILLSPNTASGRLLVWSGGEHEYGVICCVDHSVCGFDRHGQVLSVVAARPVISQLIQYGKVSRATLGVGVAEVLRVSDPVRQQFPALGGQSALRIDTITLGSPAERAGLRKGDFIVAVGVDEQSVEDTANFAIEISNHKGVTPLKIIRAGQTMTINVVLTPE